MRMNILDIEKVNSYGGNGLGVFQEDNREEAQIIFSGILEI